MVIHGSLVAWLIKEVDLQFVESGSGETTCAFVNLIVSQTTSVLCL